MHVFDAHLAATGSLDNNQFFLYIIIIKAPEILIYFLTPLYIEHKIALKCI